jgi:FkbM family methyltransferase
MNWLSIMASPRTWFARAWRKLRIIANPSQRAIFELEDGSLFECALADSAGRILTVGSLERCEREFVRQALEPGDIFFDIGANLGLFTITAARRVGPAGHVYAFEPSPREVAFLQRNLELNHLRNVTIVNQALSDHAGTAQFALAADGGNNSLMKNDHPQQQIVAWQTVALTTLDSFAAANSIDRIQLIKIDVEGGELSVLRGSNQVLQRACPPVILAEFCDVTAAGFGGSGRQLYDAFVSCGYQMFTFTTTSECELTPATPKTHYDYENLVARKRASAAAAVP